MLQIENYVLNPFLTSFHFLFATATATAAAAIIAGSSAAST
jgi:hypothetical protein